MEKLLKNLKRDKHPWLGATLSPKEIAIVIDALEKRTPKKPKPYMEETEHEFCPVCPSCADF